MPDVKKSIADEDLRYHRYTGNAIPWFVRLIWIGFWVFAIYYLVTYFLPVLPTELSSPP